MSEFSDIDLFIDKLRDEMVHQRRLGYNPEHDDKHYEGTFVALANRKLNLTFTSEYASDLKETLQASALIGALYLKRLRKYKDNVS